MPPWCREGGEPPETWTGPSDEWEFLKREARRFWSARACYDFVEKVADKGFYPDELVDGQLHRGALIAASSGKVHRRAPAALPDLMPQARTILEFIGSQRVPVSPIIVANVKPSRKPICDP